jgi:hypothetical protein
MGDTTRLERASHVVRGDRSELRVEDGRITIEKGATTQFRPTTVSFPVSEVRHATVRRPTRGASGWVHVAVVDGSPAPPSELAAAGDPYTLPLTTRGLADARKLARMIDDHVQRRGLPSDANAETPFLGVAITDAAPTEPVTIDPTHQAATDPTHQAATDPAGNGEATEHLRQLDDLHRAGVLSDDEYHRAKRRVHAP